jgi:hypothetical protein
MANLTIGGAPLVKASVGATPIKSIYVGAEQVWPTLDLDLLTTKLVWVDSKAYYGGSGLQFGQHQAGDLLMVIAVGSVPPNAPGQYTTVHKSDASGTIGGTVAYQIAKAGGTPVGTWNGVAGATTYVIRGCNQTSPIGAVESLYQGTSTLVSNAPALTLTDPSGESLVAHVHYNNATTGAFTASSLSAGFKIKTAQDRMTSVQQQNTTVGLPSSLTHTTTQKTVGFAVEVLAGSYVPEEEPLYLYDVEQTNKGGGVVDFVLKKGLGPYDPSDEGFMFRCSTVGGLDGYVPRNFTKKFPSNTAYTKFECTVEDLYGDGTANPEYLYKTISFSVSPTA